MSEAKQPDKPRFIRIAKVSELTSMSKSAIYALVQRGRFPASVKLSTRSAGWIESEVEAWVQNRITATRLHLGEDLPQQQSVGASQPAGMIDAKPYMDMCEQQSRQIADLTKALREEVEITSLTARLAQTILDERDAVRARANALEVLLRTIVNLDGDAHPGLSTWHDMRVRADKEARRLLGMDRATAAPGTVFTKGDGNEESEG